MIKRIATYGGIAIGILASIAQVLIYLDLPADTLIGRIASIGKVATPMPLAVVAVIFTAFLAYLLGRGRFSGHKQLHIRSAVYGVDGDVIDITTKLNSLIKGNSLRVPIGNHLAGDSRCGTPKHADVYYTYGSSDRRTVVPENRILELP